MKEYQTLTEYDSFRKKRGEQEYEESHERQNARSNDIAGHIQPPVVNRSYGWKSRWFRR